MLDTLHQSGATRVLFPRTDNDDVTGVMINTAGGLTGGDRISTVATAAKETGLTLTTQTAERIYRADSGQTATVNTKLNVASNARLNWLPQETILFDECAIQRNLDVSLAVNAKFLAVEPVIFGRTEMGESIQNGRFQDRIQVSQAGRLVFADATNLIGPIHEVLQQRSTANGACAMASVLYLAPDAESFLRRIRELSNATSGVSLIRPGVLFARILAPDSFLLRKTLVPIIEVLFGASLPRTWML